MFWSIPHTAHQLRKLALTLLSVFFLQLFSGWVFVFHQMQHHPVLVAAETPHSGCGHSHHLTNNDDDSDPNASVVTNPEFHCDYCALQWFTAPHTANTLASLSSFSFDRTLVSSGFISHQSFPLSLPGDRAPPACRQVSIIL